MAVDEQLGEFLDRVEREVPDVRVRQRTSAHGSMPGIALSTSRRDLHRRTRACTRRRPSPYLVTNDRHVGDVETSDEIADGGGDELLGPGNELGSALHVEAVGQGVRRPQVGGLCVVGVDVQGRRGAGVAEPTGSGAYVDAVEEHRGRCEVA